MVRFVVVVVGWSVSLSFSSYAFQEIPTMPGGSFLCCRHRWLVGPFRCYLDLPVHALFKKYLSMVGTLSHARKYLEFMNLPVHVHFKKIPIYGRYYVACQEVLNM